MKKYLAYTRKLAEATPSTRNRVVDFWRVVAILTVVFGHWLAASIWLMPDGEIALLNSLEWIPYAGWVTWLVQVMPIFFLAGGYANARGLGKVESGEQQRREWITARVRRMFTPVIPLLLVWVGLIIALRPFVPTDVVYAGAMSATVPLWFLAVYLILTALAPFTYMWWRRSGPVTVAWLLGAAIAVDIARFVFEVPGIGWVNFVFVWAAVHQMGYWWSARDAGEGVAIRVGWATFAGSLGLLIPLTWIGLYPVAMVGVPGAGVTNMTPPTFAIAVLGAMQLGIIWATQPAVRRFTAKTQSWHAVVAISGVIMTIYLWHLSSMSLFAAVGLFTFDGVLFQFEPGTAAWWVTRPAWLAILATVTLVIVAVFARFEWRISKKPTPAKVPVVLIGVLLTAGSAAAVATVGLATEDAVVQWSVPAAAIAGAALLGALPRRKHSSNG
jgi:surface polysaccharide O-acyltransferase-like enzyme